MGQERHIYYKEAFVLALPLDCFGITFGLFWHCLWIVTFSMFRDMDQGQGQEPLILSSKSDKTSVTTLLQMTEALKASKHLNNL